MEIVDHSQKMLDATENNDKGNYNFATKVISTENVGKKMLKKQEERIKRISFLSY